MWGLAGVAQAQSPAPASPAPMPSIITIATVKGVAILTGEGGFTLYTFDSDSPGHSACTAESTSKHKLPCATYFRALAAAAGDQPIGAFTIIIRDDDGTRQWAYRGKPLYYFHGDADPQSTKGDGLAEGRFHVAKP